MKVTIYSVSFDDDKASWAEVFGTELAAWESVRDYAADRWSEVDETPRYDVSNDLGREALLDFANGLFSFVIDESVIEVPNLLYDQGVGHGLDLAEEAFEAMWKSGDWNGQVSIGFAATYSQELDRVRGV